MVGPPVCDRQSGPWSECSSSSCGVGVSIRWSTDNSQCQPVNQTRLCQVRACKKEGQEDQLSFVPSSKALTKKHHIRRGHTCKATLRHMQSVRLRAGWCISEKRYRPKMCADCTGRCCRIHTSTTITVAFLCPLHANTDLLAAAKKRRKMPYKPDYDSYKTNMHDLSYSSGIQDTSYRSGTRDVSSYDNYELDELQPPSFDRLQYPEPVKNFQTLDLGYDDDNDDFHNRVKKSTHYDDDTLVDYFQNDPNRSDNLLEDAPPFEIDNLTVEDDIEFNQIKNDNYETVHHKVQWIIRCKCQTTCDSQNNPNAQGKPRPPT
ncbi:Protein cyr61 [Halocaridina rubra]|uniref:Protein cyr61 n=1 Tax=Halocaridina rubra TaxID=373956 RepID=A0AAN8WT49_HALRR